MYKKGYKSIRKLIVSLIFCGGMLVFLSGCASPSSPSPPEQPVHPVDQQGRNRFDSSGTEPTTPPVDQDENSPPMGEDDFAEDGDRIASLDPLQPGRAVSPEELRKVTVGTIMADMTTEEKVGQMIMPALLVDGNGAAVTDFNEELRRLLVDVTPGGFLLFAENIASPDQVRTLIEAMQEASELPLIVSVDQEGGVVRRIVPTEEMPATHIPAASRVGRVGDPDLAYELAGVMARELRSLGITMNLAPVADILTNPGNPVIGTRAFGSDVETVSAMVESTVRGLQNGGVSAALKHFPGHGDTVEDSHVEMAVFPHDIDRLRAVEFIPFQRGIAAGSDAVLIGHISVPAVTGDYTPASLSPLLTDVLLREELGFDGLIITDALNMAALTLYYEPGEVPLRAVEAGADVLLRPENARGAHASLLNAIREGRVSMERIDRSVRRILELKVKRGLIGVPALVDDGHAEWEVVYTQGGSTPLYARPVNFTPPTTTLGNPAHRSVVEEILRRSAR